VHPSAYEFATTALAEADVKGRRVVEVGAYNYNGSVRGVYEAMGPASYLATDAQPGPGVDLVCAAEILPYALGDDTADVLISTEMLEHAEDWRGAVTGMVQRALDALDDQDRRQLTVKGSFDAVRGIFQLVGYRVGQGRLVLVGHLIKVREPPR